jgi:hypothetical protein
VWRWKRGERPIEIVTVVAQQLTKPDDPQSKGCRAIAAPDMRAIARWTVPHCDSEPLLALHQCNTHLEQ